MKSLAEKGKNRKQNKNLHLKGTTLANNFVIFGKIFIFCKF